ncbi:MAG: cytochrome c biogenesis protein CcsA, partial [Chitinispirillaceae bacterium]|nr:cytochrome c biogenesis protein CcsA [Chitinispirillaceae bacterium]
MRNRISAPHRMVKNRASGILLAAALSLLSGMDFSVSGADQAPVASPSRIGPASIRLLERTIVLESGRKKPLAVYARHKLMQFSGKKRIGGMGPGEWLARMLFDPSSMERLPVFLINDPEPALAMGITPQPKRRYGYAELYPAVETLSGLYAKAQQKAASDRTPFDREIIRIRNNLTEYASLISLFSFLDPYEGFRIDDPPLAERLGLPGGASSPSYADLLGRAPAIALSMKELQSRSDGRWSSTDSALINLTRGMHAFGTSVGNPMPHLIPSLRSGEERWLSPWGLVGDLRSAVFKDPSLRALMAMRNAYVNDDAPGFDAAVRAFNESVGKKAAGSIRLPDPAIELLYTRIDPFPRAKLLFGLAAVLALIAVFSAPRPLYLAGVLLIAAGLGLTTLGIAARMVITGHPPVTNLYETFVFVAWASVVIGLVLEWMRLRPTGILAASLTGFLFLHIAGKYALDGDTMGMLAAVLDSSFWLTTHIVTIALGYAGCVGAGVLGHVWLAGRVTGRIGTKRGRGIGRAVYGVLCFGFLFTVIGTVFGGMWADQACGRYWGWDPKE